MFSPSSTFLNVFFAHEKMKKPASIVAEPAQIQPKSQFLFHKNLPPRDFSVMTLALGLLRNPFDPEQSLVDILLKGAKIFFVVQSSLFFCFSISLIDWRY